MSLRELILLYVIGLLYIHLSIVRDDFENKERDRRARERKALNDRARGIINGL